ncbi:MAG: hypothetical protein OEM81_01330 [Acidimicrobiia bacterium]|nr:hypothetical protein [Acidimicrobiia bacterium]MDH3396452.1 hypothetical protein [Acidimicrobiia bacterium]
MNFISEQGFDIKKGQSVEFQQWLMDNEGELASACPAGVEYVGTFANVFSSEKDSGSFRTLWAMESYGALDNFTDAMKEGGTFAQLVDAMAKFGLDSADGGDWSSSLSRRVTTAAIWGDET